MRRVVEEHVLVRRTTLVIRIDISIDRHVH
jgi:hypothetical protein